MRSRSPVGLSPWSAPRLTAWLALSTPPPRRRPLPEVAEISPYISSLGGSEVEAVLPSSRFLSLVNGGQQAPLRGARCDPAAGKGRRWTSVLLASPPSDSHTSGSARLRTIRR